MKTRIRTATLKAALTARRLELQHDVRARIREGRQERTPQRGDSIDHSDADVQEELGLALLQMRAETLTRIDEALVRLDAVLDRAAERFGEGTPLLKHRYFAALTVRQWRRFHRRHTLHHLRQVRARASA